MQKSKQTKRNAADYDVEGALCETADGLRALFRSLTDDLNGNGEHHSVVADVARTATALTATLGELRQIAKAERRELSAFRIEAIAEYLCSLPPSKRLELAEQLTGAHDGDALL